VGWVRNLGDGDVEVLAQGPELALDRLEAWLHEGPPMAHVDEVERDEGAPGAEFTDFSVRY